MIIVVGATGNTGQPLVRELSALGVPFRALARDPGRARSLLGPAVDLVEGDLERPETLRAALEGADSLYAAIGGTPNLVELEASLIEAARAAGVRHFVKLSGIRVSADAPSQIQRIHDAGEQRLRASGMAYTLLKANFFMQNFLGLAGAIKQGVLPMPTGEARCSLIDARDIARVAARVLTSKGHENREYTLTGPESLSHGDAARILSRALGRPISFVSVPAEGFKQGGLAAGMPEWLAEQLTEVYVKVFAAGIGDIVSDEGSRITARAATPLADFVRDHAAAFAS